MSVRLLTTALVLLLQGPGQLSADPSQQPTVHRAPALTALVTSEGPMSVQEFLVQQRHLSASMLMAPGGDAGLRCVSWIHQNLYGNALVQETCAGVGLLVQNAVAGQCPCDARHDVFPLERLADDVLPAGYRALRALPLAPLEPVQPVVFLAASQAPASFGLAVGRDFDCGGFGKMMLRQLCPPLRLCPLCQSDHDPCLQMMAEASRRCRSFWSGCFAQAPSHCGQTCPYPYGRPVACDEEPCEEPQGVQEDCHQSQPEAVEGMAQEAEDGCTCCNAKCQCTTKRCACSKEGDQCACCNEKCCCKADQCQCKDCKKDGQCACAGGKCGCEAGACACKAAAKKCACFGCGVNGKCCCAEGDCGCETGACPCNKSEAKFQCPFLKAKAAQAQAKVKQLQQREVTVLDNLERLAHARKLHEKAKMLERAGAHGLAEHVYRKMEKVCPGSRYESLAKAGIAGLHQRKELARATLLDKARLALKKGNVEEAYRLAEEAYGQAYSVMTKAAELLRVIDAERFQTGVESLGVEETEPQNGEPVEDPCGEPLPCEPQTYVPECVPIAVEVKVAEYIEACQRALTSGCFADALRLAELALELDPRCGAAKLLVEKAQEMLSFQGVQDHSDGCMPAESEEPCEIDPEANQICPPIPPIDPAIIQVLHRLLLEQDECIQPPAAVEEEAGEEEQHWYLPADWHYLELYIDPEECDGYAPDHGCTEAADQEPPLADAGAFFHQLVQAVSGGSCIEVDTGACQGPRVWIQLGGAHCRWSHTCGGVVKLMSGVEYHQACQPSIQVQVGGPGEVSIHIKWAGSVGSPLQDSWKDQVDLRDWQAEHEQEVIRMIESANEAGEVEECQDFDGCLDVDEDEDVNLDPCDG